MNKVQNVLSKATYEMVKRLTKINNTLIYIYIYIYNSSKHKPNNVRSVNFIYDSHGKRNILIY